ncbi:ADP-ribosylation factor-like protein 6-interacting protein 4 isoform X2 [Anguilla rostrata]
MDSPGELSFVSEHDSDSDSDSSDSCARRRRQRKKKKEEEEKKKKKKKKVKTKKSEGGVAANPALPSGGSGGRETPRIADGPTAGQTNGAFEPDTEG